MTPKPKPNFSLSPIVGEWLESLPKGSRSRTVDEILLPHARRWKAEQPANLARLNTIRRDLHKRGVTALEVEGQWVYWKPEKEKRQLLAAWIYNEGMRPLVTIVEGALVPGDSDPWHCLIEQVEELLYEIL